MKLLRNFGVGIAYGKTHTHPLTPSLKGGGILFSRGECTLRAHSPRPPLFSEKTTGPRAATQKTTHMGGFFYCKA